MISPIVTNRHLGRSRGPGPTRPIYQSGSSYLFPVSPSDYLDSSCSHYLSRIENGEHGSHSVGMTTCRRVKKYENFRLNRLV